MPFRDYPGNGWNDLKQIGSIVAQPFIDAAQGAYNFLDQTVGEHHRNLSTSFDYLGDWVNNALTGQRDYDRQVALQKDAQAFNADEAEKAYNRQVNTARNQQLWQAEQLKQLGINPAWAVAGGGGSLGSSVSTAPTASSQTGNVSASGAQFGYATAQLGQLVLNAARLAALAQRPTLRGVFIPSKK